jgi:hypothetical protein
MNATLSEDDFLLPLSYAQIKIGGCPYGQPFIFAYHETSYARL